MQDPSASVSIWKEELTEFLCSQGTLALKELASFPQFPRVSKILSDFFRLKFSKHLFVHLPGKDVSGKNRKRGAPQKEPIGAFSRQSILNTLSIALRLLCL